jgi:hypothetical protein
MSIARLAAVFGVFLLVFVALTTPITVLISPQRLERAGLSIGRIDGDWRQAVLSDVSWRGYAIGEVTVQPVFSALLTGQTLFKVKTSGARMQADGVIGRGLFSVLHMRNVSADADLAGLPVLVQLVGRLSAQIQELDFGSGGCRRAIGTLQTDALRRGIAGLPWQGPVLAGQLQCTDGAIVLPLSSTTDRQRVSATMTLTPDGAFEARIEIPAPDASIAPILPQLGFRQEGENMVLLQKGRWSN